MSEKGSIIILVAIALFFVWLILREKISRLMAGITTSKAKKEECIRQLMDGVSGSDDYKYKTCKKLCAPLTAKDLAGKKLNNQIIYYLNKYRNLDFAAEAVKQAANSKSLKEEYIEQLMNEESNAKMNRESYAKAKTIREVFEKVGTPLTTEDFAERMLSKEAVYSLDNILDTDFIADIVIHAPNSEALIKKVLDDVYSIDESNFKHAEAILKAVYHKGIYTKEIEAKQGDFEWHRDNGAAPCSHRDHWNTRSFEL